MQVKLSHAIMLWMFGLYLGAVLTIISLGSVVSHQPQAKSQPTCTDTIAYLNEVTATCAPEQQMNIVSIDNVVYVMCACYQGESVPLPNDNVETMPEMLVTPEEGILPVPEGTLRELKDDAISL